MAVLGGAFFLTLYALSVLPSDAVHALAAVAAAGFVCALAVRALRRYEALPLVSAAVLSACILVQMQTALVFRPIAALDGRTVQVTASPADLPQAVGDNTVYHVLRTYNVDGAPMRCRIGVYHDADMQLEPSQTITFTARLRASERPDASGVWLRVYRMDSFSAADARPDFFSRMLEVRRYTIDTLLRAAPGTNGAVLAAMVTGDTSHIPADVYAHMRSCGIVHIFSVSGFHLSVFSMVLYRFLQRRNFSRFAAVLPSAALVLFFMAVTGFSYSCVRAGVMLLLLLFGRLFFWQSDPINSMGASLLILGFIQPFCAGDVGLQLSALGTLGVILSATPAERFSNKIRLRPRFLLSAVRAAVFTLCVSASIQLLTMHVIAMHYGTVSLIAPLANAVILFAAQWAMIGAAVSVLLSVFPPFRFLFYLTSFLSAVLARFCVAVADFLGSRSFADVRVDRTTLSFCTAGTLILIAAVLLLSVSGRRRVVIAAAASAGLLAVCTGFHAWSTRDSVFITVPDVGNRSCVLVQSRGETALIGCGAANASRHVLQWTDDLDLLLLPRASLTESALAGDLVKAVPCREIWLPARVPMFEGVFFHAHPEVRLSGERRIGAVRMEYRGAQDSAAVSLTVHGKTILLLFESGCDLSRLPCGWADADIVIARSDLPPAMEAEKIGLVLLARDASQGAAIPKRLQSPDAFVRSTAASGELRLRIDPDGAVRFE